MRKMSASEYSLRRLSRYDVRKAILLSNDESWNQTEADWTFLIENPKNASFGVFDNERLIGTVTAMKHDCISWIGMVLVDKSYRGRGIGKTLISTVLKAIGLGQSIGLDATPAGKKVYAKFGFQEEYRIHRMTSPGVSSKTLNFIEDCGIRPVSDDDMVNICAYDAIAFGAKRNELLEFLLANNRKNCFLFEENDKIEGFVLGRTGSNYYHIGPLMASSVKIVELLILKVIKQLEAQAILLDVVADKMELVGFLENLGFSKKRHFIRMYQEENLYSGLLEAQYLIGGPEYG
ncbi:GNAT family N-acetyltransferase [uncultured Kriegella sp.]|uniref:GNAT family N-acetyltransferase n=1 Tax=uncultured Kriegella sp. TaxID=1798910 RepID=UPI0030D6DB36|tara:strand:+ start:153064 stop:153936 length:873 start_codon:yes stop_codon:yes gene_type:complete